MRPKPSLLLAAALLPGSVLAADAPAAAAPAPAAGPVSFYKTIRPIFQARCHGCHQPAKAKGDYIMTDFAKLLAGGEDGAAIVPGDAAASALMKSITPHDGKVEMPKSGDALTTSDVALIAGWITQGAVDDTPPNARQHIDAAHPPVYARPPVITSLDYSKDGKWLAVSGFHEVLIHHADGSGVAHRLIGLSEKITSVRFSPDGKWLAVTGGLPARMGEVQIWDVAAAALKISVPVTFDTVYGASWSPDSSMVAFGCASDKSVRVIQAEGGKQILSMAGHDDWVFDTLFTVKGDHVVSTGRDMTAKLTELATQRFVDNLTSITPGALKGGLTALARHPERDEFLVGGADGVPQLYRVFRQVDRRIGDNSNLVRRFPAMQGRVFAVAWQADGKRVLAASSLDGKGELNVYKSEFDTALPESIKAIYNKVSTERSAAENAEVEKYQTAGTDLISHVSVPTGLYAAVFSPDGSTIAAGGQDGKIRMIDPATGNITKEFVPVAIDPNAAAAPEIAAAGSAAPAPAAATPSPSAAESVEEKWPADLAITKLTVEPDHIVFKKSIDYTQLLVTAQMADGTSRDATRLVQAAVAQPVVRVLPGGLVRPVADGGGRIVLTAGGQTAEVAVEVSGTQQPLVVDYIHEVTPVMSRMGCNAGTCHGAKDGKAGFKLSLRGYDPVYDLRAFTDDIKGRRTNVASPDDSLMLMKATAGVPHEGGQVTKPGSDKYQILRSWIAAGAEVKFDSPRVTGITLSPTNPVIQLEGSRQQMRVLATYADGRVRDVTQDAFVETGNMDVAKADKIGGLLTALRRGEAPVLARYEGSYASTVLTVMGDRTGFAWQSPPANNKIDEFVAGKLERMKTLSSALCTDLEFIRRVHLDLTGLPPEPEEVRAFISDASDSRWKREQLIDRLIASEDFTDHWTNKWCDLLQVNSKFLGAEGASGFRDWVRGQVAKNVPYDQFVKSILTATGSNKDNPPASYYKILREPAELMENTTHLFLATRFNCNKCHDHPFERWTQDQYYQLSAFFARTGLERDPASGDRNIGGSAVEGAKPLFEKVVDRSDGEVKHDRTGAITPPKFPYQAGPKTAVADNSRRQDLAAWITSPDNPYFARSFVNRLWGYLNGVGLIEPLDDIRAGNPPSNPELLDWLAQELISHNFDFRHVVRLIARSRTYQLSHQTNKWNVDDKTNFSHAAARRLPAETLLDTIYKVTGTMPEIPGVAKGIRAAQLPDSNIGLKDGFLTNLGRPVRESACECERSADLQLGPIMALISGPTVGDAISNPANLLGKLVKENADDAQLVKEIFMRVLSRPSNAAETEDALAMLKTIHGEHDALVASRDARAAEIAPAMETKSKAREAAVATAQSALDAVTSELAPAVAKASKEQQERVGGLEKSLAAWDSAAPAKVAEWEARQTNRTLWNALPPQSAVSENGAVLAIQPDQSVLVSGAMGKTVYTITLPVPAGPLGGLRLEALQDPARPTAGPGRSQLGNFVLTEIDAALTPASGGAPVPLKFNSALATFSQEGYDVKTAIDGNSTAEVSHGWAIAPKLGENHTAVFGLENAPAAGGMLTVRLHQRFADGTHTLAHFRLSSTSNGGPPSLDFPAPVSAALAVAAASRTPEQIAALTNFVQGQDAERIKLVADLAVAKTPLPEDPRVTAAKAALATASLPVPPDPLLERLRRDVDLSAGQLATQRLTAAQDLTWALINTPAFLFNH
ncbi:MAG: repeat-containing protein [Verrucomicrobiales bacterium]|nr:repeat-containing protein [Verrucomicrobiales bacterium]